MSFDDAPTQLTAADQNAARSTGQTGSGLPAWFRLPSPRLVKDRARDEARDLLTDPDDPHAVRFRFAILGLVTAVAAVLLFHVAQAVFS